MGIFESVLEAFVGASKPSSSAAASAAGVGLLFGIYPAKVAAGLDPVAALRAE